MPKPHSWQSIQQQVKQRIEDRTWLPGDLIPGEVQLAEQFGCSRSTVNRALRELALTGIIDRKRKAGTRVAVNLTRKVSGEIPVTRLDIENRGSHYRFTILDQALTKPNVRQQTRFGMTRSDQLLHIRTLHYADDVPFLYENRWINTDTVPDILTADFAAISVNEWLVSHVPFTTGKLVMRASNATQPESRLLQIDTGQAILAAERTTWIKHEMITMVKLYYSPNYQLALDI